MKPPAERRPASADAVEVFDGVEVRLERPRRVRSPSDVLRLLIGGALVALGLILATVADRTVGGAQADLVDAVSRLPEQLEQVVVGVAQVIAVERDRSSSPSSCSCSAAGVASACSSSVRSSPPGRDAACSIICSTCPRRRARLRATV